MSNSPKTSFMTLEEIQDVGFGAVGINALVSRKASFYSPEKIFLGNNVRIDDFCVLSGEIKIGNFVHIAAYGAIFGSFGVQIDDYSGISVRTTIISSTDDISGDFFGNPTIPNQWRNVTGSFIELQKYSWVGAHCLLLPGAFVAEGTAIGASSVLMKKTKPWSIYMGNPAILLRERNKGLLDLEKGGDFSGNDN